MALWANLAFISCRQYGVQILDISNPDTPRHIGIIRVGEVQSATVSEGILYCGVWGKMKVVVVDIRDITKPTVLCEIPLMGRGDGVHVKDGILYAASGQHARGLINSMDYSDPAFGMGNGVEIFDVHNPADPKRLKSKFLGKGYCTSVDMWEPALYGDTLVVNNSILGVFGLDPVTMEERFHVLPPTLPEREDAVTGVTGMNGDLFVATSYGGLFACREVRIGEQLPNPTDFQVNVAPHAFSYTGEGAASLSVRYSGLFPVLDVAEADDCLALACAEGGVHLVDKDSFSLLTRIETSGMAQDVKNHGDLLFVALEKKGIEIFRLNNGRPQKIGAFIADKPIYQLAVSESGKYLLCALASNEIRMLDVSDTANIKELYRRTTKKGPLYGNNFAANKLNDGTMLLFCHRDGLIYTNPDHGDMEFHSIEYKRRRGFCGYCAGEGIETDGEQILYTADHGYTFLPMKEIPEFFEDIPHCQVEKGFRGLLTLKDGVMIVANRAQGVITILDVINLAQPRILAKLTTNASPSKAIFVDDRIFLPGGRGGLLELNLK